MTQQSESRSRLPNGCWEKVNGRISLRKYHFAGVTRVYI